MFSSGKIAAVGDADLLFGLKALGVTVFSPQDASDMRRIMVTLEKEKFVLCWLHQDWLDVLSRDKKKDEKKLGPVVIGFADYRMLADTLGKMVREMSIKATGSDALVKRKGKDESS